MSSVWQRARWVGTKRLWILSLLNESRPLWASARSIEHMESSQLELLRRDYIDRDVKSCGCGFRAVNFVVVDLGLGTVVGVDIGL